MISVGKIIAVVERLRADWAKEAVRNPDKENPVFAYGQAAGRDAAAELIIAEITEMLNEEEDEDGR